MTRQLKVTRGRSDRDPMFAPIWYDGSEMTVRPFEPDAPPPPPPVQIMLPLPDPEVEKWQRLLDLASEVTAVLRIEKDFDGYALAAVANAMVGDSPTADDIIAAYRRRMAERRNG